LAHEKIFLPGINLAAAIVYHGDYAPFIYASARLQHAALEFQNSYQVVLPHKKSPWKVGNDF
jgi:hypothetical protein